MLKAHTLFKRNTDVELDLSNGAAKRLAKERSGFASPSSAAG